MTVKEAIEEIRQVGTVLVENGAVKLRIPEVKGQSTEAAIEVLRQNRQAVLDILAAESRANRLIAAAGVRFPRIAGVYVVAIRRERDSPQLRDALEIMGSGAMPVKYLDEADVPARYKDCD